MGFDKGTNRRRGVERRLVVEGGRAEGSWTEIVEDEGGRLQR